MTLDQTTQVSPRLRTGGMKRGACVTHRMAQL